VLCGAWRAQRHGGACGVLLCAAWRAPRDILIIIIAKMCVWDILIIIAHVCVCGVSQEGAAARTRPDGKRARVRMCW